MRLSACARRKRRRPQRGPRRLRCTCPGGLVGGKVGVYDRRTPSQVGIKPRDEWLQPGEVLHYLQASEARLAWHWRHALLPLHPSVSDQLSQYTGFSYNSSSFNSKDGMWSFALGCVGSSSGPRGTADCSTDGFIFCKMGAFIKTHGSISTRKHPMLRKCLFLSSFLLRTFSSSTSLSTL